MWTTNSTRPRPAWPRNVTHAVLQLVHLFLHRGRDDVVRPQDIALPPYYPDTPRVRADLARHYNNVHRMDARVGEILDQLAEDGLLDATVVMSGFGTAAGVVLIAISV